nr:MAG TPA: hypothetical protein [Caudoviricetes sp.]
MSLIYILKHLSIFLSLSIRNPVNNHNPPLKIPVFTALYLAIKFHFYRIASKNKNELKIHKYTDK